MFPENNRDVLDYFDDTSHDEDETAFIPTPEPALDRATPFFIGILLGLAGGFLMPLQAFLASLLITVGYGLSAFSLRDYRGRPTRAIRTGFTVAALLGLVVLGTESLGVSAIAEGLQRTGQRHLAFPIVALLPWAIAVVRYVWLLIFPGSSPMISRVRRRVSQRRVAPRIDRAI